MWICTECNEPCDTKEVGTFRPSHDADEVCYCDIGAPHAQGSVTISLCCNAEAVREQKR